MRVIQVLNPEKLTTEIIQDMRKWWGSTHVDYQYTKNRFVLIAPGPVEEPGPVTVGVRKWIERLATFGIQAKVANR